VHNSRAKTKFLFEESLRRFLEKYAGRCVLLTLTFKENVTDKAEAERRFKPVKDWLVARKFFGLGVWQRQKRGAWHLHLIASDNVFAHVPINLLRDFAVGRGWGSFLNVQFIKRTEHGENLVSYYHGKTRKTCWRNVIFYLSRYLSRDVENVQDGRVRLVCWVGQAVVKIGNVKFSWVNGAGRAWRLGCAILDDVISYAGGGYKRRGWQYRWRDEIMEAGWAELEKRNLSECHNFFSAVGAGLAAP
jgi:hypothetical protein